MHGNTYSSYDDQFVEKSVDYGQQVHELRLVRDALSTKRSALSLKRLEMSLRQEDMKVINKEILTVMQEWRKVSDQIDELLELQLDHVTNCRVGNSIWGVK